MADKQDFIDKLIDQIDQAVLKHSVSNRDVAAVLSFLNEELKNFSIDDITQELKEAINNRLRKDQPDQTNFLLKMLAGAEFGEFIKDATGAAIWKDEHGNWHIEGDYGHFRKKITAEEVEIQHTSHIGGKQISTIADMTCSRIEEFDNYWRCYFRAEDTEGNVIYNQWAVGDLAYVETFNLIKQADGTLGNHFLWRRVASVSDNNNIQHGEHYIDITKADGGDNSAAGSDAPLAGDDIVQLGHLSDPARQNAIIQASAGNGAPYFRIYNGIHSFSLPKPQVNLDPAGTEITAKSIILESSGEELTTVIGSITTDVDAIKRQNDNMWTLHFTEEPPTMENHPAVEWATDEDKENALQDIVVIDNPQDDTMNGRAWRFHKSEAGEYYWTEITDIYLLQALGIAVEGRDNARQKRRNFVNQPTDDDVYEVGDTWSNATYLNPDGSIKYENDNLVATAGKAKGAAFNIAHWRTVSYMTTSEFKVAQDEISGLVQSIVLDEDGNITNISKSGLLLEDDFATLFSERVVLDEDGNITNIDKSGLLIENDFATLFAEAVRDNDVVTQAQLSAYITEDEFGQLISNVEISADQIHLEGYTSINGNTIIHEDGTLEAVNGIFKSVASSTAEMANGGFHVMNPLNFNPGKKESLVEISGCGGRFWVDAGGGNGTWVIGNYAYVNLHLPGPNIVPLANNEKFPNGMLYEDSNGFVRVKRD